MNGKGKGTRALLLALALLTLVFAYGRLLYPHSGLTPSGASLEAPSAAHRPRGHAPAQ